jgi:hypothetical protein
MSTACFETVGGRMSTETEIELGKVRFPVKE